MSELPYGWSEIPLGSVAEVRVSNVDKKSIPGELSVKLCNYLDVYRADYLNSVHPYMDATATHAEVMRFRLRQGDVVITKDSETPDDIGVASVIDEAPETLVCGYHLAIVRPSERLNSTWFAKQCGHERSKRYFGRSAVGTTRYGLSNDSINGMPVLLPPRPEQDRAAQFLRSLDESIVEVERVITKLEQIRHGLLHDVLTRGIDDNGEIRDPARHPEQFKDSEIGSIPIAWATRPLLDTALSGKQGFDDGDWIEAPYITDKGIRLIQTGNIGVGEFLDKPDSQKFISDRTFKVLGCKWVHPGDTLICRLADPIGRACVVPDSVAHSITAVDCTIYRPSPHVADAMYMLHWLNSATHLKLAADVAAGSTRQRISRSHLGALFVAVPPLIEQREIAKVLDGIGNRLHREEDELAKLIAVKSGLSDDLLTGRVRVQVAETAA